MTARYFYLLLAVIGAGVAAKTLPELAPFVLKERTPSTAGGWALSASVCPTDLDVCGSAWCCPTSLTCVGSFTTDNLCCPGSLACDTAFTANPYCADDSWSLWDVSTGGINNHGYFCCMPGQIGLMDGKCIASNAIVAGETTALALLPGGLPISKTVVTATATATANATSISVHTFVTTTTVVPPTFSSSLTNSHTDLSSLGLNSTTSIFKPTPATSVASTIATATFVSTSSKISTTSSLSSSSSTSSAISTSIAVVSSATGSATASATTSPVKTSSGNSYKNSGPFWAVLTGFALTLKALF